jgi:hypothetical protein
MGKRRSVTIPPIDRRKPAPTIGGRLAPPPAPLPAAPKPGRPTSYGMHEGPEDPRRASAAELERVAAERDRPLSLP